MEDLEDDHGTVHHLTAHLEFKIPGLRRRNLVVHQDGVDDNIAVIRRRPGSVVDRRLVAHEAAYFLALAGAQIGRRIEARALLREGVNDLEPQGFGEIAQFGERRFEFGVAHRRSLNGSHHGIPGIFTNICLHSRRAFLEKMVWRPWPIAA